MIMRVARPLGRTALSGGKNAFITVSIPTPAGLHSAMPYLIFDGMAVQAIAFYCEAFGATELPGRLMDPAGRV